MADEIRAAILDSAQAPAAMTVDGVTIQERSISEMIEADRHLRGAEAAGQGHFGIRISQIVPPGGE